MLSFASKDEFEAWLAENHAASDGIWIKIAKKGAGVESVAVTEALDVALCFGWIDGQRKPFDETYFLQKYTPRRARSKWSKRNVGLVAKLIEAGEMQPRRPRGDRAREGRRALGRGLRLAGEHAGPARSAGRARRAAGRGGVLRDAQLDQPLLDPLPPARRQAARDAGAAAGAVRRDARARRDALLARMRLLVTGGAGYIGSIVAQQLLARGDDVTVLDSLYRGHRAAVPEGAAFVEADLLDPDAVDAALAGGFDGVVHFAALSLVAESVEHPERYWRGNVVGALNLLDAMRAAGVPRLVFSSTAATYGEPAVDLITEDTPNAPVNAYGNSKLAIDRMLADEARAHGLAAVSLRYFNVAGASGRAGRGPHARDAPDPARAAGRGGQARERRDLRHRLPDAGRHRGARLHPRRGSRAARTSSRWSKAVAGATTSTTSAPSAATRCAR